MAHLGFDTGRTRVNFEEHHFCTKHKKLVDWMQINEYDLLILKRNEKPTNYKSKLEETSVFNIEASAICRIKDHFEELEQKIQYLAEPSL